MKKIVCFLLIFFIMIPFAASATENQPIYPFTYAFEDFWFEEAAVMDTKFPVRAAVLMEASTGKILFAQSEDSAFPIASVTKVMSTLLVMEAIDEGKIKLDDLITVGEDAAKMGGSQVYLEVGEKMSVHDMLKALIVASANDATVAMAEHICGSEESFVALMNQRAAELGMKNTHFANSHGLNEDGHYSSALDVAIVTRELLKHELVLNYTTIWMDTIRNGAFGLANTNKLIRFYNGANGMKTGYTDHAKYCLSATAKRDNVQLIAVVLGADSSDERFSVTKKLLDFGFANFSVITPEKKSIEPVYTNKAENNYTQLDYTPPSLLIEKGKNNKITEQFILDEDITAPILKDDVLGEVVYYSGEIIIAKVPIFAAEDNRKISFRMIFSKIFKNIMGK
ncbi:D-alanyl-D-alanine carboxypeptidase [Eubacteriales bacterium OttesenSCG-928-G02]|nr:D-alanyl-D-alanine carboxypeptidase [Eubacteriales bacterium OttesenSCG-928-G02]